MKSNKDNLNETWINVLIGVLAILAIKALFEDDNSKIVSKKGRRFLSDNGKMRDINKKIEESEGKKHQNEIFI